LTLDQKSTSVVVIICAGLFLLDRVICVTKYVCFSHGTTAIIIPLANGSTRITLNRSLPAAKAGSHAFLWLPCVQALQPHPSTMVSASPVAFILKARNGFTKDLNIQASSLTNMITPATIDAPYGVFPLFEKYDMVLLLAGGSRATWAVAVAMDLPSRGYLASLNWCGWSETAVSRSA
jgi:predicted ferric reductase